MSNFDTLKNFRYFDICINYLILLLRNITNFQDFLNQKFDCEFIDYKSNTRKITEINKLLM